MKYLVTPSADSLSGVEAVRRGCNGVTTQWWATQKHPTTGATALVVPDDDVALLPPSAEVLDAMPADWTPPHPDLPHNQ